MGSYGLSTSARRLRSPKGMAELARRLREHRAARPLSYLLLRTLKQASYQTNNVGHFGLASDAYLHFTSPIRRYPDLHVHRLVKRMLRASGRPAGGPHGVRQTSAAQLAAIANEASSLERRALDVEREVHSVYAASTMRDRVGERHDGTVIGVTPFGFFVSIDKPFVDGLVKVEQLAEDMSFDPDLLRLFGQGRIVSLGDSVEVEVLGANVIRRQIDFAVSKWGETTPLPDLDRKPTRRRKLRKKSRRVPTRRHRRR
jgi:ribonuclease R